MVFILSALWETRIRGLWKLPDGRDWLRGTLGLVLMGWAMLSKSLIQLAVDEQSSVASLLLGLRPSYGGGDGDDGDLLQKLSCMPCCSQYPRPRSRLPLTHAPAGDSWALAGKSGSASCGLTAPFSWVLVCTRFCLCPLRVCLPSPVEVLWSNPTGLQSQTPWGFSVPLPDPQVGKSVVGPRTFLTENFFDILFCSLWVVCSAALWWGLIATSSKRA